MTVSDAVVFCAGDDLLLLFFFCFVLFVFAVVVSLLQTSLSAAFQAICVHCVQAHCVLLSMGNLFPILFLLLLLQTRLLQLSSAV